MRALQVRRVVGIELCKPAVDDARANARRNGVANCHFIASKAEDATKRVLQGLTEEERASLVAIVDPPRAGLHADVVKALRSCTPLRRLLYVSCHAPGFVQNAVGLCRPTSRAFEGEPFVPTAAYALDLFPHTHHCELIVLLERRTAGGGAAGEGEGGGAGGDAGPGAGGDAGGGVADGAGGGSGGGAGGGAGEGGDEGGA